jgi:hypothetical protein
MLLKVGLSAETLSRDFLTYWSERPVYPKVVIFHLMVEKLSVHLVGAGMAGDGGFEVVRQDVKLPSRRPLELLEAEDDEVGQHCMI